MRLPSWIVAALLTAAATAAASDRYHETWRWGHIGVAEDLPAPTVLVVAESADSVLWVGTRHGLAWYDGYRFHVPGPERGVPDRPVSVVKALGDGRMVYTLDNRLYVGDADGFAEVPLPFAVDYVAYAADAAGPGRGRLGILSHGSGVYLWEDDSLEALAPPSGVAAADLQGLSAAAGSLWLRTTRGLYRLDGGLDGGRWVLEQEGRDLRNLRTTDDGWRYGAAIVPIEDRGLWAWTEGSPPTRIAEGDADIIREIIAAGNRLLTIYESGAILARDEAGAWQNLEPLPEAMRDVVRGVFRHNGDLVLATRDGLRIHRLRDRTWERWHTPEGGARNRVDEILETRDGDIWLGTDAGVEVRHADGTVSWHDEALGRDLRIVTALREDDDGGVWVGSGAYWEGAFRYHEGRWAFFGPDEGMAASRIHRIHRGNDGTLYFLGLERPSGAYQSLGASIATYRDGRFSTLPLEPEFGGARVHGLDRAPDGSLWLCGTRGIARLRDGKWTYWTVENGLYENGVFALVADADGGVFFTDQENGLGHIGPDGSVSYRTTRDGLIHDEVWDLEMDAEGHLWIATRGGLSSWHDGLWRAYGARSGLEALELWPVAVTRAGVVVGSGGKGAFVLRRSPAPAPQVRIDPPLVATERVVVRWRVYPYRGAPPRDLIQTRVALDDGPWSPWSTQREATFSGLDAGTHGVRVQVAAGIEAAPTPATADFVIPARLYARPGFFLPVGLSLAAVLFLSVASVRRRRRDAAALAASESRYRGFFRQAPISLMEQDYAEVHAHIASLGLADEASLRAHLQGSAHALLACTRRIRILDANDATLELFACPDRETLALQLHRIFRREAFDALRALMLSLVRGDERFQVEATVHTLDGERRHVLLTWALTPDTKGRNRALVSALDTTAQQQVADQLRRAAAQAEEASRAKSAFLANTSHEIRTPINAVMGMAQALQEEDLPRRAGEQVETILSASESLARVIDDLLDLSKIEAGQFELEHEPFEPAAVVEAVRRTLVTRADAKDIRLDADIDPATVATVTGDPARLRQVLLNLIGNALKFTEHGGVRVRLRSEPEDTGHRLYLEVEDTGIGIPADQLEQIFEPFAQADTSVTRIHGGTGLGLSISRRLVEMMGGALTVDSRPGAGSTFRFHLRVEAAAPTAEPEGVATAAAAPEAPGTPLRILLVEDNDLNRRVVHALLRRDAHRITEAHNGEEALSTFAENAFDVVLMDMQMPVMDGLTATRRIRQLEAERGLTPTPVVALTANAMRADRERCLAAGMNDFIAKPVRRDALRTVLDGLRAAAPSTSALPTGPPPEADPEVLDPSVLDGLRDLAEVDETFTIGAVIQLFLEETPKALTRARAALDAGERTDLHREVHSIKGSAREVGGRDLARLAEALETSIKNDEDVDVAADLDRIETSLSRLRVELERVAAAEDGSAAT